MTIKHAEVEQNTLKEILDHAKVSNVIGTLLSCLVTCGISLMSAGSSSNLLRAACEACEAIWSLIDSFEIQSTKENAPPVSPFRNMYVHSLDIINSKGDEYGPFIGKDCDKIVEAVAQAFLTSEDIRVAIFHCLRQRLEASWSSVIQIMLRCCLHNESVASVLCGISNSSVVSRGGDNTIISQVFSIISLCASFDRHPQLDDDTNNNLKSKVSDPSALILHSCLLVASVAQSLVSSRTGTAVNMLTSSPKTQQCRISDLAHHYSLCNGRQHSLQTHSMSMSAILALASILYLESRASPQTTIYDTAFSLIPQTATLCDYIRILTPDDDGDKSSHQLMLSYWHGFRDGCVGLLYYKLIWAGSLDIHEFGGVDMIQNFFDFLGNKYLYETTGLSQFGVLWMVNCLRWFLKGGPSIFRQVFLTMEHVKVLCDLISDVHLKLIGCSVGPGGGKNGIRDIVQAVSYILQFPLDDSVQKLVLQNMESCDKKSMVVEVETSMHMYIQIILEVGLPGQLIKCLEHLELKDTAIPVQLLSIMVNHRSLALELVGKGLLNPKLIKRLLNDSSPTQIKIKVLQIVSEVAKLDEEFHKKIEGADIIHILQQLKAFLTHEDPYIRGWTCNAIGEMCRHSSYFYSLLATQIIALLVGLVFDKDIYPRCRALLAPGNML
ncbi:serine/threonine-protein kinase TIO-like isoform X2 [Rutidosis leptorrhynchoides]|uniref:serine/threonine-protein kinase TIO-like isoform X2 n=1 Tax=Rutidosis leptorrhynchoides TaxID=125765 RepID=UPI003A9919DC